MNDYSIALFSHVVGALGVSVAFGLEWIGLSQIRRAILPQEIRAILGVVKSTVRFGFASMLTTVLTGIYLVVRVWGWVPWVLVVLGALVLTIGFSRVITAPRMLAIGQALVTEKSPVTQTFHNLVNHPALWISIQVRIAIVLGIILLKFAKPGLGGSLLTIGVAIILGVASALPMTRPAQAHEGSTD